MTSSKDSEEPLKAIVFADSCGSEQRINLAADKTLLNTPILSWQLAALARYGVKEAVVLSSKPIPKILQDPLERIKVTPLSSTSWTGEGDALREVESRDDLRPVDDFILVRHGSIFNIDVSRLVLKHKQRRDVDRNWLITTTFRRGAGSATSGLVVAVDSATGTLVKYVENASAAGFTVDVRAENAGLHAGGVIQICSDVLDIGLDVCAPDFMTEFRENFYYDNVRAYIKEKLDGGEAEVFGNRMYAHFLQSAEGEYGSRITSLASLAQATSDILNGWMCPISETSDLMASRQGNGHEYSRAYIVERSTIGHNVDIGVGSTIIDSVIGNYVSIGSDTVISHSIVMNNVLIADRTEIERSIIDTKCMVREDSFVPRYCYVDREVYLGVGCRSLPEHSLVTLRDMADLKGDDTDEYDSEGESESGENGDAKGANSAQRATSGFCKQSGGPEDMSLFGANGKGKLVDFEVASRLDYFFIPQELRTEVYDDDERDEIEDDDEEQLSEDDEGTADNRGPGVNGQVEEISRELGSVNLEDKVVDENSDRIPKFNEEVFETIERAFLENVEVDNTTLEINSLKLVYHCSFAETLTGVVAGLAKVAKLTSTDSGLYGAVHSSLVSYKTVIAKFSKEDKAHQLEVASGLARALSPDGNLLSYVYKVMYDEDMLEEEAILGWAAAERRRVEDGTSSHGLLEHGILKEFLEWLVDSEDEEDED